jgi:hypothetical protein
VNEAVIARVGLLRQRRKKEQHRRNVLNVKSLLLDTRNLLNFAAVLYLGTKGLNVLAFKHKHSDSM